MRLAVQAVLQQLCAQRTVAVLARKPSPHLTLQSGWLWVVSTIWSTHGLSSPGITPRWKEYGDKGWSDHVEVEVKS